MFWEEQLQKIAEYINMLIKNQTKLVIISIPQMCLITETCEKYREIHIDILGIVSKFPF